MITGRLWGTNAQRTIIGSVRLCLAAIVLLSYQWL